MRLTDGLDHIDLHQVMSDINENIILSVDFLVFQPDALINFIDILHQLNVLLCRAK